MSTFRGGSFGGFGSNNQQQQNSGFGASGFGANNNTGGFGSSTTPFGTAANNNTSAPLFGSTGGGFGSTGVGGFGSNNNTGASLFGAGSRPFGTPATSSGPSLFGASNTATAGSSAFGGSGGGAFGSNTGGSNTTPFGSSSNTGSLFGAQKPAFGGGGFGSTSQNSGPFGAQGTALGGNVPPSEGTAITPFAPFSEKDPPTGNVTSNYQSITFMQPYSKYSFEELRLADYDKGQKFGNPSGQAGAFGSSAFGGFGQPTTNTGFGATSSNNPFGAPSASSSPFGQTGTGNSNPFSTARTSAPSLFGQTTTTTAPNMFGGSGTSTFGGGQNTGFGGTNTAGSLFGSSSGTQNRPLFGTAGTNNSGGFGNGPFGQQTGTTSGPGLFGSSTTTTSPFGGQQQSTTGPSLFGQPTAGQNQSRPLFGGSTFGSNQQQTQPANTLFGGTGTTSTGSTLFGGSGNNQQQGSGSLFPSANTQQSGGNSLFSNNNNQPKPNPFGTLNTGGFSQQQPTGQTVFGNQQQQAQQQPQRTGLFGSLGNTGGGNVFGSNNNSTNQTGGTLLGGSLNQPQPQQGNSVFGSSNTNSVFGTSQQNQQQQQPQYLQASLLEGYPYGNTSLFSGLPLPNPSPGPLATPLLAGQNQQRKRQVPITYKADPRASTRLLTPPAATNTFGFSYSGYGTPSSVSSSPGTIGRGLFGGSFSRGSSAGGKLVKSLSANNIRSQYSDSASILSPGAFSASSLSLKSNPMSKKVLRINRNVKVALFDEPEDDAPPEEELSRPLKPIKRVSFDSQTVGGDQNGNMNGALVRTEADDTESMPEDNGWLRSSHRNRSVNGSSSSGTVSQPEMEQVKGNELAIVHEDAEPDMTASSRPQPLPSQPPSQDPKPGEYWMRPSKAEINRMPRDQVRSVKGFTVGRQSCGEVTFDEPVDLSTVPLDDLLGGLIRISVRSITVYPEEAKKPPQGKGLNVPSTLKLENSWPRGKDKKIPSGIKSGPSFEKHVQRLRRVNGTEFVTYEKDTGVWVFKVPHFTTYGMDYEDDEDEEIFNESTLSAPPDTPTPKSRTPGRSSLELNPGSNPDSAMVIDSEPEESSAEDDTFDFKKKNILPGAYGNQAAYEDDEAKREGYEDGEGSFLDDGSAGSASGGFDQQARLGEESAEDEEMEMAGSFPNPERTAEHNNQSPVKSFQQGNQLLGTPGKAMLDLEGDWGLQLQRTISPRKQDREALREVQGTILMNKGNDGTPRAKRTVNGQDQGIKTSIDLMNSLFGQHDERKKSAGKKQTAKGKRFEWPYSKKPKTFAGNETEADQAFHDSFKPRWGPNGTLLYAHAGMGDHDIQDDDEFEVQQVLVTENKDIVFLAPVSDQEVLQSLKWQSSQTEVREVDGVPIAQLQSSEFRHFVNQSKDDEQSGSEAQVWRLAHILFDEYEDEISAGVPQHLRQQFQHRIKKDRLTEYWQALIRNRWAKVFPTIQPLEERAIAYLSAFNVSEAVKTLIEARNPHLATLIAQIGNADEVMRHDVRQQIDSWHRGKVLSEMADDIRALYEILAGNVGQCDGKKGGPLEDRVSTFLISERFSLDWLQAFGLRLWYSILEDEPIEAAVTKFQTDLDSGVETAFPYPWRVEINPEMLNENQDTESSKPESPLWVLLKLYAASKNTAPAWGSAANRTSVQHPEPHQNSATTLPQALDPTALSGSPFNALFTFQLHHALCARVSRGSDGGSTLSIDTAQADKLAADFATQLSNAGIYPFALFALLHLHDAATRERMLREMLAWHAPFLPDELAEGSQGGDEQERGGQKLAWQYLTGTLKLPAKWIYEAKALYARDRYDYVKEVEYLLRAGNANEAHATFCRFVAPRAVIERDYDGLQSLLKSFGEKSTSGPPAGWWEGGGGVYEDFVGLALYRRDGNSGAAYGGRRFSEEETRRRVQRLSEALVGLAERKVVSRGDGVEGLEERVAVREMAGVVAGWRTEMGLGVEAEGESLVLQMPLSEDVRLARTVEMCGRFYAGLMVGAA